MKIKYLLWIAAATSLMLATPMQSCSSDDDVDVAAGNDDDDDNDVDSNSSSEDVELDDDDDDIENSTFNSTITISYSGGSAVIDGSVDSVSVVTDGANVVVNSNAKGVEYVLNGSTTNGSLKVYSTKKFKLSLQSVSIVSTSGPAINIQSGKRAFIVLTGANTLTDSNTYTTSDEDQKATLFSEGKMLFSGSGSLTVNANYKHAICSDDYIRFYSGEITVAKAAKDAIHSNDAVVVSGGSLTLHSVSDGIDCSGYVIVDGGSINATIASDGSKGIKCDSYFTQTDGLITIFATGNSVYADNDVTYCTAIKSDGDMTIAGGKTIITSSGKAGRGLSSDANINISSGDINIQTSGAGFKTTSSDAASAKCITSDANVNISGGSLYLKSTGIAGKGLTCDGKLNISGDADIKAFTTGAKLTISNNNYSNPKAIKSEGDMTIDGGNIYVSTKCDGGEGIESKTILTINGGCFEGETYDDAINASQQVVINGGMVYAYASNNDGIDSNGTLTITGGVVVSSGTTTPEEGFDCDNNTFKITGGLLVGTGGSTSTPTSSACTQRSVVYGGSGTSGQYVCIYKTSDNTQLLVYKIPRQLSQMTLLFSSSDLAANTGYTINVGGNISGGNELFHGIYLNATYTNGSTSQSFTTSSMVTSVGNSTGGMGGGGWH